MRAPRLLAAGTAAASLLLLSGCGNLEKPSPLVSIVSGGRSVHSEATSYCFDGQSPKKEPGSPGGCSFSRRAPQLVQVRPGDQIGVDVAKTLADTGWVVVVKPQGAVPGGEQPREQSSQVQDSHYFAFPPPVGNGPIELQVRSLASSRQGAPVTGLWRFILTPK